MSDPTLPEDLVAFLRGAVPSVWTLELLLLMHRRDAEARTVEQLTHELRANRTLVADVLASLHRSGLVIEEGEGTFRYQPASAELGGLVARLSRAYAETPFAVRSAIVAAPNERIQMFADAFRLRKE